jgi:hypothetical protein
MRKIVIAALFVVMLAACGSAAQGPTAGGGATTQPLPPGQPTTEAPVAPTKQPTSEPAPTGGPATAPSSEAAPSGGASVRPPDDLVATAQRQLATYLKLTPDQIVLQSANREEWPDGSLGCPAEGMAYPQVVTEGFRLLFADPSQTQSYEVHTATGPAHMVLCQNGKPADLSVAENPASVAPPPATTAPAGDAAGHVTELARAALAQELGVNVGDITVVSADEQEWSDSSLGCPKEGEVYLQVITPGYLVTLEAEGQRYEYHTDSGQRIVRCELPQ